MVFLFRCGLKFSAFSTVALLAWKIIRRTGGESRDSGDKNTAQNCLIRIEKEVLEKFCSKMLLNRESPTKIVVSTCYNLDYVLKVKYISL